MTAKIIDGRSIAAQIRSEVAVRARALRDRGVVPGFVDLLIGADPASETYVRMKNKAARELGMHRNTLSRTINELHLDVRQFRDGGRRPVRSEKPALPLEKKFVR